MLLPSLGLRKQITFFSMKINKTPLRGVIPQRAKSPMIGISTLNFPVRDSNPRLKASVE